MKPWQKWESAHHLKMHSEWTEGVSKGEVTQFFVIIFSHGIPKHRRKGQKKILKKNHDFVFLFKQASERMHCWVSAPSMQPVGICLNQDILTAGFIKSLQEHLGKLKFNILT